jgi:hypothetical protein
MKNKYILNAAQQDFYQQYMNIDRAMAQAVSRRPPTVEARVNPCGICGGQSGTGTDFSPSSSAFSCKYKSFYHRSPHSHQLGDEQYVRSWQQFRDVVHAINTFKN